MLIEPCDRFAELLVDYADGGLDDERRREVEAHLATCSDCRARVAALQGSLRLARAEWSAQFSLLRDALSEPRAAAGDVVLKSLPAGRGSDWGAHAQRWRRLRLVGAGLGIAAAAAVLMLALRPLGSGTSAAPPGRQMPLVAPPLAAPPATLAQVQQELWQTGAAAELLAVADLLAQTPGGQSYATDDWRLITELYPHTAAALDARKRLGDVPLEKRS